MSQNVKPDEVGEPRLPTSLSRSPQLRTRLLFLVVACIVPLFAFGFGNAYFDYQNDCAQAGRNALVLTRTLALLVQRDLEARLATLQVLASSKKLKVGDLSGFRARAEAVIVEQLPGSNILLLREDGQQVMNTALPSGAPLPARRDTTSLQRLFATAQPSISDVFVGMVTHRPTIALEVPVRNADGNVIYSLTLNPAPNVFSDIVHRQQLNTGAFVSILDRQGVIVARMPNDAQFVGKMVGVAVLSHLATQSEGIVENVSQDGIPVVSAFSQVPTVGWSVVVGLPRAELVETARHATLVTVDAGLTCLVFGLGLAHVMARRIARPIIYLRNLSVALEQHSFVVPITTGLAETDEVAQVLIAASRKREAAEAASRRTEQERERAATLLRTVIETAPSLIYAKDLAGRIILANNAFLNAAGKTWAEVTGRTDIEFRDNQVYAQMITATDRRIMISGETEAFEEQIEGENQQPRIWLATKAPLSNTDGEVIGLVGVSVEITERKHVEDRLRLMVNELNHRVKNTLATVQSIALHTLRRADRTIRRKLEARLMALASAHDVLTRERWEGANLMDVMAEVLIPYGGVKDSRFHISGLSLRLQPRAAVALAMGLHELATNALKYGALSVEGGHVEIKWSIVNGASPCLHITWSEWGGPPVIPPTQQGFGSRLIEHSLAQDLGGATLITFAPEGITCTISAPLAEVLAGADVALLQRSAHRAQQPQPI